MRGRKATMQCVPTLTPLAVGAVFAFNWSCALLPQTEAPQPPPPPPPVAVAQTKPHSGHTAYDSLVDRIAELEDEAQHHKERRRKSRSRLAHKAGLPDEATDALLSEALRRRTFGWAKNGLHLRLQVENLQADSELPPAAELSIRRGKPRAYQRRLIDALTRAARDVAQSHAETRVALVELRGLSHDMATMSATLKQEPASVAKTKHLQPAIDWAARHLKAIGLSLRKTAHHTTTLLAILEEAANTERPRAAKKSKTGSRQSKSKSQGSRQRASTSPPRPSAVRHEPPPPKAARSAPGDFQP